MKYLIAFCIGFICVALFGLLVEWANKPEYLRKRKMKKLVKWT